MTTAPLVLLVATAWGQDPEDVDIMQTARLNESAYGNHEDAIRGYTELVRRLAADDPLRAEALYRLAFAEYSLGNLEAARDPLFEANRTGVCHARCQMLLGQLDLERNAVRQTPIEWDFSNTEHGLHHPWRYQDKGGIRVETTAESRDPALVWRTTVDVNKGDQLVIGFENPAPAPEVIRFTIGTDDRDASIRVRLVDDLGRNYGPSQGPIRIRPDTDVEVELKLRKLIAADPSAPPLDPSTLARMYIEDVSAFSGTPPGEHELSLDDFVIE